MDTWSDRGDLELVWQPGVSHYTDEGMSVDYTWHGGVGTDVKVTERVICTSA